MNKNYLYALIPVLIAVAIRLYPYFTTGMPFSTDAWSPIRNAELLIQHTPIHLGDNTVFDGYNNYWPGSSLFGAVFSLMTGFSVINAMAIGIPLTAALTILIFYALVNKVTQSPKIAFAASILLATAYPYALFTAGVTKETFTSPLLMLAILIFLSPGTYKKITLFTIAAATIVFSHHLTTVIALAVLTSITLASSISRIQQGRSLDRTKFACLSTLTATAILYYALYARLPLNLTPADWLTVASYQTVAFAAALYFTLKPQHHSKTKGFFTCFAAAASVFLFILLCTKISVIPGAPILPSHYILYAAPFVLLSALIVIGAGKLRNIRREAYAAPIFWIATLLGLEGYAFFAGPAMGLTLASRTLNYLWPPLAILCAIGLHQLYQKAGKPRMQRLMKLTATAALILIVSLNSYNMYASVSLQERYMGYFWLYTAPEYEAAAWTAATTNQSVAGDVKVSYLLKDYFNVKVNVDQGLKYLTDNTAAQPKILFVYGQMQKNGYVLYSGISIDLAENWTEKTSDLNLIYSNGQVKVYTGGETA